LERKEQYRSSGFGFDRLLGLVAGLYNLNTAEIVSSGKQPLRVEARDLLSFWAVRELGISVTDVATRVGLTQPAVSRAVHRGEQLARERNYSLGLLTERMKS